MSTLLLRLAGPLQSWGASSRFSRRLTEPQPTKSGVTGLLAAAMGRRRTDSIEDLLGLTFGVRLDQPGRVERDFQTAHSLDGHTTMPLSQRYYLSDAVFLAGVEGDDDLISSLDHAFRYPQFPLYLGRRSCPPVGPVTLGGRTTDVRTALQAEAWQASLRVRRCQSTRIVCDVLADASTGDPVSFTCQDVPVSFDPERRRYTSRAVTRFSVELDNPDGRRTAREANRGGIAGHDPMNELGGP